MSKFHYVRVRQDGKRKADIWKRGEWLLEQWRVRLMHHRVRGPSI